MDTTETYIKMCEKALPDIGGWAWQDGDFGYRNGKVIVWNHVHAEKNGWGTGEGCIPLFRQDQSQEMVADRLVGLQTVCAVIYDFAITEGEGAGITINGTMEQLWLAFVMHELHGKVWSAEKEEWT